MSKHRGRTQIWRIFAALALVVNVQTAGSEEVRVFTKPPSADEMGALLFPDKMASMQRGPKTRSLTFSPAPTKPKPSVAIALPIQFDFNSATIREDSMPYLNEIGRMLTMEQFKDEHILIEGHTDASGTAKYNDWLSVERAKQIKKYLISHFEIKPKRMKVTGLGEHSPLPGKDPFDALNRRVELHRLKEGK